MKFVKKKYLFYFFIFCSLPFILMNTFKSNMNKNSNKNLEIQNEINMFRTVQQEFQKKSTLKQTTDKVNISAIMNEYVQKHSLSSGFSGMKFVIQCPKFNSGELKVFTSGFTSLEKNQNVSEDSIFQIGSITKSFVSIAILKLEKENISIANGKKFSLSSTIDDIFPNEYSYWKDVSIEQLLHHTSCLPGDFQLVEENYMLSPFQDFNTNFWLDLIKDKNLVCRPGEEFIYANENYILLGKIIEKLTNSPLAKVIEEKILKPLSMDKTYFVNHIPKQSIPSDMTDKIMSGYYNRQDTRWFAKDFFKYDVDIIDYSMSWAHGAAALSSNVADLSKYASAIFNNRNFLSEDQYKELTKLVDYNTGEKIGHVGPHHPLGYGLGLMVIDGNEMLNWEKTTLYGHTGATYGFQSNWYFIPEKQTFFSMSVNAESSPENFDEEFFEPMFNFIFQECI